MYTFLDDVIESIKSKQGEELRKTCLIFPTRRACLIFRKRLAEANRKPAWSPGIKSIGDFIGKHIKVEIADEIPLLLTMFDVYRNHWPEKEFGRFYAWGKMLLNDFDEVDKQLNDPTRLFTTVGELRKIEATFFQDPESLQWVREFLDSMNAERLSKLQQEFAKSWDSLRQIYEEFNTALDRNGISYEGKAYREVIGDLKSGKFNSQWNHFIFAGFYGFSRAEEQLISLLQNKYKVTLAWDSDDYYVSNPVHEAGTYFRKTKLFDLTKEKPGKFFSNETKNLEITAVPLMAAQAKYAGQLLSQILHSSPEALNKTAIILPDEMMLFPVLHSIPEEVGMINVTMGYPVASTHFADFFSILYNLHRKPETLSSGERTFSRFTAESLIDHPLIRSAFDFRRNSAGVTRKPKISVTEIEQLYQFEKASLCFSYSGNAENTFIYLENLLTAINQSLAGKSRRGPKFEAFVLQYILSEILVLKEQLRDHFEMIGTETIWQMIRECVSGLKIPFSGEPVTGLQIMGFLESRALDFETVIIPNLNEGILPASGSSKSFIPYSLRKGFGLSTYEDQDASWSYHFYRLMHRAKNIHLIYNTEVSKVGGGEPSRYLLQIKHELKKYMGDRLKITEHTLSIPIEQNQEQPVTIMKDDAVMSILNQFRSGNDRDKQRSFSSTALTTYVNCSLQFYFRYIAGLREKDEPGKKIEAADFGNILHDATEKIYTGITATITADQIESLLPSVEKHVNSAISEKYGIDAGDLEGNDIILAEVIKELVKRILKNDQKDAPFRIISLEGKYAADFNINNDLGVSLFGKFDRVDEKDGEVRIIDYKTGKVKLNSKTSDQIFTNPDFKALFQLYFYTLLFRSNEPDIPSRAGIYLAKSIGSGIQWPKDENAFDEQHMQYFSKGLSAMIAEIFNTEVMFTQTEEIKRCVHCPYQTICRR